MNAVDDINRVVVLAEDEARLIAHVLAVLERVLRLGALDHHQLEAAGARRRHGGLQRPDVELAEVVVEASEPLLRQLM